MNSCLSLILINWLCFRIICTLIMCMILRDQKTQALWTESCRNRLVEMTKEFGYRVNKASLEQKRCCSHCCSNHVASVYEISRVLIERLQSKVSKNGRHAVNMLLVALIPRYKRSMHERKIGELSLK